MPPQVLLASPYPLRRAPVGHGLRVGGDLPQRPELEPCRQLCHRRAGGEDG